MNDVYRDAERVFGSDVVYCECGAHVVGEYCFRTVVVNPTVEEVQRQRHAERRSHESSWVDPDATFCVECDAQIEAGLARLGSIRCLQCRTPETFNELTRRSTR